MTGQFNQSLELIKVMTAIAFTKPKVTPEDVTLSLLTGAGLSFLMVWDLYPCLSDGQEYKDLVIGALTWVDYDKDREWKALNLLFAGFVIFSMGMLMLFHHLRKKDVSATWIGAVQQLFRLAWLPAVFWLGTALMRPDMPFLLLNVSGFLVLLFAFIALAFARNPETVSAGDVAEAGLSSVLILMLGVFSVVAVIVAVTQFSIPLRLLLLNKGSGAIILAAVLAAIGFICWNTVRAGSLPRLKRGFHRSLLLLQITPPLLLFVLVSQYGFYQGSMIRLYQSSGLIFTVCVLVLFSWHRLYRHYQRWLQAERSGQLLSYRDMLSPASLYPIAVYTGCFFFSWATFSFAIDDFHIGEQLLPWQQIVDFGKLPYFDFAPIHGLMALAYGGLNAWFYDGTVATFPQAMLLLTALFIGLSFWSIYSFQGPWPALLLSPLLGIAPNRLLCLVPVLLLFSRLLSGNRRVAAWLPLWLLFALLSVLYNVPVGAGLILGSLPLVLYRGWLDFSDNKAWIKFFLLLASASVPGIVLVTPLRHIAGGFLHFILDNASTNTAANGVGILQMDLRPHDIGFAATQFQWVFLKLSWIIFIIGAVTLLLRTLVEQNRRPEPRYIVLLALIPLTFFVIGKWSMERISPGDFIYRDGALSFLSLTFFLPLLQGGFGTESTRSRRHLALALIIGITTSVAGVTLDYRALLVNPTVTEAIDDKNSLVSGKEIGLPRLGKLFADPQRIEDLQSLRKAIALYLEPGETFLDLSNRSALYYYLDLPVPVVYSADYVAANTKSLGRMIEQIKENPPPLALIAPRLVYDGGPASLRSYLLYKELVSSYVPRVIGKYTFLIRADRIGTADRKTLPESLDILDPVFRAGDLQAIPNAWGRSWRQLKDRFTTIRPMKPTAIYHFTRTETGVYRPTGDDPYFMFDISPYPLAGKEADFLLIDYACARNPAAPEPILELYWNTENDPQSEKTVLRFFGSGKKALIPMGAQPRWLLAERIVSFRLDLLDPNSCRELRLNSVELLKLNARAN
ncbi:hypothetical protein [Methylosarcina fibrata]|uniref:hypothetical protein n=1 Tax=Methylosarcina fibrata TaxID=105972 RepID=UPI00035F7FB7|nr:hypothetical protein [Methylosarcina fibrata]